MKQSPGDVIDLRQTDMIYHGLHQDPALVPDLEVVKMATRNASNALGIYASSVEAGKLGDIIIIDLVGPYLTPVVPFNEIYSHLISAMGRENVSTVITNGQAIKLRYKMKTIDKEMVINEVNDINQQIATFLEGL